LQAKGRGFDPHQLHQIKIGIFMDNQRSKVDLETPAISVLAAASKTPFRTAFMVTLGIGLGGLILFGVFVGIIAAVIKIFY
jgi:hypothetical protein